MSNQDVELSRSLDNGVITGQVAAADTGAPLSDVFVVFQRFDSELGQFVYADLALSDETGEYSAVLPAGSYRVGFLPSFSTDPTSTRYLNEYFNDVRDAASATTVIVTNGATARADAALTSGGSIVGTVKGAGEPLADVVVFAYATSDGSLVDTALSDETGAYTLTGLPAGTYRIEFAPYLSTNETTKAYVSVTRSEPVNVTSGGTVSDINADLTVGGTISGSVTSSAGGILGGVLVLAINPNNVNDPDDDALAGLTQTDATGVYRLSGLATGSYDVVFETALTGAPDVAAHIDTTIAAVAVTAGQSTEGVNVTLARGGQIRGEVRDAASGFTLSGVLVEVFAATDPTTPVAFAITDEQGIYASNALAPGGSYLVRFGPQFTSGRASYAAEYFSNAADIASAQAVAVPDTTPVTGINANLEAAP